jgi:hypothetical protein
MRRKKVRSNFFWIFSRKEAKTKQNGSRFASGYEITKRKKEAKQGTPWQEFEIQG